MPRKSPDTYSRISRRARSIPVDSQYAAPVAGIWTTVLSSQASRVTEVAATTNPPAPKLSPFHQLLIQLEYAGRRGEVRDGRTVRAPLPERNCLWVWIASQMQKQGYPDIRASDVQMELQSPLIMQAKLRG